jgi:acyl carrier protein
MDIKSELIGLIEEEATNVTSFDVFSEKTWKELKIDSLSTYSIITRIEDNHNIKFSNEDIKYISTPSALINLAEVKINGRNI